MKTEVRKIGFYDSFRCIGADCPLNCCHGWKVPIEDDLAAQYKKTGGFLGVRLRCSLAGGKEDPHFSRYLLRCPMHDRDGLCALQKKRGEQFMPSVCRSFPREWANTGYFVEQTLDLSCIEAARLFLEASEGDGSGLSWITEEREWDVERAGDNDDPEFLKELVSMREDALSRILDDAVASPGDLDALIFALADEAKRKQNEILKTDEGGLSRIGLFPFSIMLLNELMSTCFYEDILRISEPELFRMCRRYYRVFDRLTEIEGQKKLDELTAMFFSGTEGKRRMTSAKRYFAYCLMRSWFETYEDYSFLRRIKEAAVNLNMVLLFELLAFEAGTLDAASRAGIVSMYEKRARHNGDAADEMMRTFNARF